MVCGLLAKLIWPRQLYIFNNIIIVNTTKRYYDMKLTILNTYWDIWLDKYNYKKQRNNKNSKHIIIN